MKYIKNRELFLTEEVDDATINGVSEKPQTAVSWLDSKKQEWEQDFNILMTTFHTTIEELIETLKEDYNDKDDPTSVKKEYIDAFNTAFENLIKGVMQVEDDTHLIKMWRELSLNFTLWKNTFKTLSEDMDNYNSIFKLGNEFFNKMSTYITSKINQEYDDVLKGDIDDMRSSVIEFLEDFIEKINIRFEEIDEDDIFSMSNLEEKETDDIDFVAGDVVRYHKDDGEENEAIISHNQEELENEDDIRLVSKTDSEQFTIDKSQLIEILPKHKTINQEVVDKLKIVKDDPDKLDRLNDVLTNLTKEEEK